MKIDRLAFTSSFQINTPVLSSAIAIIAILANSLAACAASVKSINLNINPTMVGPNQTATATVNLVFNRPLMDPQTSLNPIKYKLELWEQDLVSNDLIGSFPGSPFTIPEIGAGQTDMPMRTHTFSFIPSNFTGFGEGNTIEVFARVMDAGVFGQSNPFSTEDSNTVNVTVKSTPEPISTLLGTGLTLGIGGLLKRKHAKSK